MSNSDSLFRTLCEVGSLSGYATDAALDHLARLIDLAGDHNSIEGTLLAIRLGAEIGSRQMSSPESALLNYFISNAWANHERLTNSDVQARWACDMPST